MRPFAGIARLQHLPFAGDCHRLRARGHVEFRKDGAEMAVLAISRIRLLNRVWMSEVASTGVTTYVINGVIVHEAQHPPDHDTSDDRRDHGRAVHGEAEPRGGRNRVPTHRVVLNQAKETAMMVRLLQAGLAMVLCSLLLPGCSRPFEWTPEQAVGQHQVGSDAPRAGHAVGPPRPAIRRARRHLPLHGPCRAGWHRHRVAWLRPRRTCQRRVAPQGWCCYAPLRCGARRDLYSVRHRQRWY